MIYVGGRRFQHCKAVVIKGPIVPFSSPSTPDSTDELRGRIPKHRPFVFFRTSSEFPPEDEFWGICSNLQAWVENDYDTSLLRSTFAFPLLKALADVGDPLAKKVFGKSVATRFSLGHKDVVKYLIEEHYHRYLMPDDISQLSLELLETLVSTREFDLKRPEFARVREKYQIIAVSRHTHTILQAGNLGFDFFRKKNPKEIRKTLHNLVRFNSPETLEKIQHLPLISMHLKTLPDIIYDLKGLTFLHLDFNVLKTFPEGISRLRTLQHLTLLGNRLESLPDAICHLQSLESFDVSHNRLQSLPASIHQLQKLRQLNLRKNCIQSLPNSIGNLQALTSLDIEGNQLQSLPDSIGRLHSLFSLNLSDNQLETLPDTIGDFCQKTPPDFLQKSSQSIPPTEHMKSIYNQQIDAFDLYFPPTPDTPDNLPPLNPYGLPTLDPYNIPVIAQARHLPVSLFSLDLSRNRLQTLPETICNLRTLKRLDLSGNPYLILSPAVVAWIEFLKTKGAEVTL